jgi:uncharacterized membrane protein YcaP (DUF421 family)
MDWNAVFGLTMSPWELILRGTLMYWFLFLLFRFLVRRRMGSIGLADMLVLVLLADAAQNAMAGGYGSFSEGAVLVATIVGWNVALDWLAFRVNALRRLIEPSPLPLVWRGRIVRKNLREEFLSVEELMGKLREKGVEDLSTVKAVYLESDGEFSVLQEPQEQQQQMDDSSRKSPAKL